MRVKTDQHLRVGIVGLGFGASVHAPVLLGFPDVKVVGLAGKSINKAQAFADKLGIPKGFGSVEDLLKLELDAITLALPPCEVSSAVETALKCGVPILCEKPLGIDGPSSKLLAECASDITTAMDFIFSELEVFKRLKIIIDENSLGRVRHANLLWLTESWAHQTQSWSWKTDASQLGGVLSLFGTHVFYLAEWLFGKAKSVSAHIPPSVAASFAPIGAHPAEDLVGCSFIHTSGAILNCNFGNASPGITIHRWTVVFDEGTIIVENDSKDYAAFRLCLLKRGASTEYFSEPLPDGDGRLAPFRRLARRFLDAVREGSDMKPDFKDGARVQFIDTSVRASAAINRGVCLD